MPYVDDVAVHSRSCDVHLSYT